MSDPYDPPQGHSVGLAFSGEAYTPPAGDKVALEFLPQGGGPGGESKYAFPDGFDAASYGEAGLRLAYRYVIPPAIASTLALGRPELQLHSRYLRPAGTDFLRIGTATRLELRHRPVAPSGFDAARSGQARVINRNRHVYAGNIQPPQTGRPAVALYTRYLVPPGLLATQIPGSHRISHEVQRLLLRAGITPPPLGNAWASHSPRTLAPRGAFLDAVGAPAVGWPIVLQPVGFDSLKFGTRITPEALDIYPPGVTHTEWGRPWVRNQRDFLQPQGFQTTIQEQYRFGWHEVWNLRQYIVQYFIAESGLAPPPLVGWTAIANRNRHIQHHSTASLRWGTAEVANGARSLAPAGIPPADFPPDERRGLVAHAIRSIALEGIAPYPVSRWSAIYNAGHQVRPQPFDNQAFGYAALESTRRYFRFIGGFDTAALGEPFVAPRIRTIPLEQRYAIHPPPVPLPEVKLHTRYVAALGEETLRFGWAYLRIHWNILAPHGLHQNRWGFPALRNLTPEVRTYGHNSEAFGDAFVRLEWRPVYPDGSRMDLFGRARIADRTQRIQVPGNNYQRVSDRLDVVRLGAPPYSPQGIILEQAASNGASFGRPSLVERAILPPGIDSLRMGAADTEYRGIHLEYGIWSAHNFGEPAIGLKNRVIAVETPAATPLEPPAPQLSPHTIYAVKEAPLQAVRNHPPRSLHYVGETFGVNPYRPGERFGERTRISHARHTVSRASVGRLDRYGMARAQLRVRSLAPGGIRSYRLGWHTVGDGSQTVTQFGSSQFDAYGRPTIVRPPYTGPQTVRPPSMPPLPIAAAHWVSCLHREFRLSGLDALRLGGPRPGDTPYMWQGLRVGPLMPTIPSGFDPARYGKAWVSLRVRELQPEGFDPFASEYEPRRFAERMRVRLATTLPPPPPEAYITPVGLEPDAVSVPNIRLGVHYIRPDGDADQYRKGAW